MRGPVTNWRISPTGDGKIITDNGRGWLDDLFSNP